MYEQMAHHSVMRVFVPIAMRGMYYHVYGSIPGKGVHRGKRTVERWIREDSRNCKYIYKLDIRHFFDNIIYPTVKKAFPSDRYSEQNRILLALLCSFRDTLPQGAPTSPGISNIIMRDFDFAVGQWCDSHAISYTRYCDDMTFSGEFDPASVIAMVRNELQKTGLFLNESKTTVVHKGQKQQVTGIVVNEAAHIPNDYKRKIRQEMYFCKKYGVSAHLDHLGTKISPEAYTASMLGRVNYVLSVEPSNSEMLHYRDVLRRK